MSSKTSQFGLIKHLYVITANRYFLKNLKFIQYLEQFEPKKSDNFDQQTQNKGKQALAKTIIRNLKYQLETLILDHIEIDKAEKLRFRYCFRNEASIYLNQEFPPLMSAKIILDNIITSSAPASFTDQICFEVTFSVLEPTEFPINWKVTYVGSAYSEDYDQVLEEFQIPPIDNCGIMKFDIACQNPDASKIPRKQLLCVTALILTASYRNQEFIRVGYYVHNQLITSEGQEIDCNQLELQQLISKIKRTIISDKPRVTKFNIEWLSSRKNNRSQDSQSKLSDYFSASNKSQQQEQDSTSQKIQYREQNQKQSTLEQSQIMLAQ